MIEHELDECFLERRQERAVTDARRFDRETPIPLVAPSLVAREFVTSLTTSSNRPSRGCNRLLVDASDADGPDGRHLSKLHVLAVIGRRSLPSLIEATLFPALSLLRLPRALRSRRRDDRGALVVVRRESVRRMVFGGRVPADPLARGARPHGTNDARRHERHVHLLPAAGHDDDRALSVAFLASLWVGQPIIGRLAHDFCPLSPEIASRPSIKLPVRRLTVLWAGVHLLSAADDVHAAHQRLDADVRPAEDAREPRRSRVVQSCSPCRGRSRPHAPRTSSSRAAAR